MSPTTSPGPINHPLGAARSKTARRVSTYQPRVSERHGRTWKLVPPERLCPNRCSPWRMPHARRPRGRAASELLASAALVSNATPLRRPSSKTSAAERGAC